MKKKNNPKPSLVIEIKESILKHFKPDRVVSLLYFGTRAFGINPNNNSDYDFFLVLDKYAASDIMKLRNITQTDPFRHQDLNINFLYLTDLKTRGKSNFQIRSVQSTLYEYLATAKTLFGTNIFKADPINIRQKELSAAFDFKIQEYYGRCDKLFLQNINNKTLYMKLTKYIRDMIRFTLIRNGVMNIKDMARFDYQKIFSNASKKKTFSKKIVKSFKVLLKPYENTDSIAKVESVRRNVYKRYLQLLSK